MSWHFSLALEADYSRAALMAGELSAQWKSTGTDGTSFSSDSVKELLTTSPSGMTYAPSMASHGEAVLTWYQAAFPVRRIPRPLEVKTSRMISGRKCGESWQRQLPGTYLPRTPQDAQLTGRLMTLKRWVTKPAAFPFPRQTWVATTYGPGIGFVHTPTATANYAAPSMQKWPGCRAFVRAIWSAEPGNPRVLNGLADRVERLEATGDGQVAIVAAAAWRLLSSPTTSSDRTTNR